MRMVSEGGDDAATKGSMRAWFVIACLWKRGLVWISFLSDGERACRDGVFLSLWGLLISI